MTDAAPRSSIRTPARLAPALIALVALLIQALTPAAAMAARAAGAPETMVICTGMGVKTVAVGKAAQKDNGGESEKGFAGLPCQDCLAAATAALPPPEPIAVPVAYVTAVAEPAPRPEMAPKAARAPPRPLGQGPPTA